VSFPCPKIASEVKQWLTRKKKREEVNQWLQHLEIIKKLISTKQERKKERWSLYTARMRVVIKTKMTACTWSSFGVQIVSLSTVD